MTSSIMQYDKQQLLLSALTPGFLSFSDLEAHLCYFSEKNALQQPNRFNNRAIFDTEVYRTNILNHVDTILTHYSAGIPSYQVRDESVHKELIWVALQLYARIQAIDHDVGIILEPALEFEKRVNQLSLCQDLLAQAGFDTSKVAQLKKFIPIQPQEETQRAQSDETWFQWVISCIDKFNDIRLFWVWGRPTLDLELGYLSATEAQERLSDSTYLPGQISWSLYLLRGGIFFREYLKKRCTDPEWLKQLEHLSPEEKKQYIAEYQRAWWNVYKYRILNDFVWGPINLACFDWWSGEGFYGWLGDAATVFLLCMDVSLSDLNYQESEQRYQKVAAVYDEKERALRNEAIRLAKLVGIAVENIDDSASADLIAAIETDILKKIIDSPYLGLNGLKSVVADWKSVHHAQLDSAHQWAKQQASLNYDRIYAYSLLFTFAMNVTFLLPGGMFIPAVALALKTSGTILCMSLTIVQRTAKVTLETSSLENDIHQLKVQEEQYLHEFEILKDQNERASARMKALYDHLKDVSAQLSHKEAMIYYHNIELVRTTLMRFLVPTLIGLTLMYAPAAVGIIPAYVFVLAFAALLSYTLAQITQLRKPPAIEKVAFDEEKYQAFLCNPKKLSQPRTFLLFPPVTSTVSSLFQPLPSMLTTM